MKSGSLLTTGLACLVIGCSTIPKIPLDEFYRITDGDAGNKINIEIDTKRDGKIDVISSYEITKMGIGNEGTISDLDYDGFKKKNLLIMPDFSEIPRISLDEIAGIMVSYDGILIMGINTKKDGNVDLAAIFDMDTENERSIDLNFKGYDTVSDHKFHLSPKYHPKQKIDTHFDTTLISY
ncbi:MAG: hypothetical protein WAU65_03225 [Candidatus Nanoarchaeia archaeon]